MDTATPKRAGVVHPTQVGRPIQTTKNQFGVPRPRITHTATRLNSGLNLVEQHDLDPTVGFTGSHWERQLGSTGPGCTRRSPRVGVPANARPASFGEHDDLGDEITGGIRLQCCAVEVEQHALRQRDQVSLWDVRGIQQCSRTGCTRSAGRCGSGSTRSACRGCSTTSERRFSTTASRRRSRMR